MEPYVVDDMESSRFVVHRRTMTDAELFECERRLVFDRCWLYLGHESEIREPHSFQTRTLAGRPLLMLRQADGRVAAFINSCTHRGAPVCKEASGKSKFFRCFYHLWTFDTTGALVNVPDEESYGDTLDKRALGLVPVPRLEAYRGFVFVSFDPAIEPLADYLGPAADYLDLVANSAETEVEVIHGTHGWGARANWKMMVENSMDSYHVPFGHKRYLDAITSAGVTFKPADAKSSGGYAAKAGGYVQDLGHGHTVTAGAGGGFGRPASEVVEAKLRARRERLEALHGADYVHRLHAGPRNCFIFPNLFVIDLVMGTTVRLIDPVSVNQMRITGWMVAPRDEDPDLRQYRLDNSLGFWGPAGLASPDDVEIVESCQVACEGAANELGWIQNSRGITRESPLGVDEYQMRTFWRRWNQLVTGTEPKAEKHTVTSTFQLAQPESTELRAAACR
ncbi:aromatic ring-hydroxylating oxygenase subunit alpha [Amycolatopsis pithecellobii]|uniref:Rieske 2Fe-2S domain-containing protein n=1 Tax=Amycolatopsis pithecellobii TaxID=664692 RepID=A0A6N7Z557_9PSEU|nr:aromatic ring-hydroxylating dioxygenase subunit alpha [Amycolatopsis pithecellobii]MTD55644.1 Rieske 2Fe-2S domain-containing protein [Amycolatopsis pithecellobii]